MLKMDKQTVNDYIIAMLSKLYLTNTGIITSNFKSIEQF